MLSYSSSSTAAGTSLRMKPATSSGAVSGAGFRFFSSLYTMMAPIPSRIVTVAAKYRPPLVCSSILKHCGELDEDLRVFDGEVKRLLLYF